MKGWKESTIWRGLLALAVLDGVLRISDDIFGDQPWWGVLLTLALGAGASYFTWRDLRVFEKVEENTHGAD